MLDRLEPQVRETAELESVEERAKAIEQTQVKPKKKAYMTLADAHRAVARGSRIHTGEQGKVNEGLKTDNLSLTEPLFADHKKVRPEEYERILQEAEEMTNGRSVHEIEQLMQDKQISMTVLLRLFEHYYDSEAGVPPDKHDMIRNLRAALTGEVDESNVKLKKAA